ncbi:carbonic anhydrase [Motilibacter rhizosphaerae]|uniref:carbonic anhydrase n=1 Tax=Motilibacter rhizosphaerae TaxID=598652 RepID=A0A4Q7NUA3_9ACTN|nr:carbonic anhydrase [Motilibacter rhizosphaerae]RZS90776.1 carbonic anhydrase [Motilibacter rhizosphaerae]
MPETATTPIPVEELLAGNARYAEGFDLGALATPPRRGVAVVSCMDSRYHPGTVLGLAEGDAHILRNAGGVVTDDVLRSLVVSQRKLGTRQVVVVQHTQCGQLTYQGPELADEIERETGQRPPFDFASFTDLEASVRDSVAKVRSSAFLPGRDAVSGFVYDVTTGRLSPVA